MAKKPQDATLRDARAQIENWVDDLASAIAAEARVALVMLNKLVLSLSATTFSTHITQEGEEVMSPTTPQPPGPHPSGPTGPQPSSPSGPQPTPPTKPSTR